MEECDLIMKGGITSGVVYPKVITELAAKYRLVNLGGTSAGAIGAGFAAAAEYSRQEGREMQGFDVLDSIPDEISPKLLSLFEPRKQHRKTFRFLLKMTKVGGIKKFFLSIWNIRRVIKSFKKLPTTHYGLCSGISADRQKNLALTDWMNLWLEKAAGRLTDNDDLPEHPLTFGMLEANGIKLRTVTTNLSQRTPVALPDLGASFVKKTDLEQLMPDNVFKYVEGLQDQISSESSFDRNKYFLLPSGDLMPVLMGIRLSLSFPILLAAFPIYRVDYSTRTSLCPDAHKEPSVCWLSDGGITSNFPIHLFDSLLPSRPTFGISLGEYHECRQAEDENNFPQNRVYLPMEARQGQAVQIHHFVGIPSFLMGIFNAAQTWQDANQTYLPGYRERVIRLALKDDEGGMNLEMPPERIASLTTIGKQAGITLRDGFNMNEHRWRRLLSSYAALEKALEEIEQGYTGGQDPTSDFLDRLIASFENNEGLVTSYNPHDIDKVRLLKERLDELISFGASWTSEPLRGDWGSAQSMPKPTTALKITPERFTD